MATVLMPPMAVQQDPHVITEMRLSGLVSDVLEVLSHGGPTGAVPDEVTYQVITPAAARGPLVMSFESCSTVNDTVSVRFFGSDLTNMVVRVKVIFKAQAAGGTSE